MLCDKVSQQIARTSTTKTVKAKFHCFSFHPFILDLVGFFLILNEDARDFCF